MSESNEVKLCVKCHTRKGSAPGGLCRHCWEEKKEEEKRIPPDLAKAMGEAKTEEDWRRLAYGLNDTIKGVADGTVKANAAQTAMLKEIMARAYGKPQATQAEKSVAAGVIILPALNTGATMTVCPRCGYNAEEELKK